MKIHSKDFRVPHHKKIDIKRLPTIVKPFCESKKEYKNLLEEHVAELTSLQHLHYASNRYASAADFSRDGLCRQRWRDPARHVRESIRKAAKFSVSNNRAPKNWNMIFSGARHAAFRNADGSASSIVPTMRKS